jgi:hypothetical protein
LIQVPAESIELIKQVLKQNYLTLRVSYLTIRDDLYASECSVEALLESGILITGTGVGTVDALFRGFRNYYAKEYQSLTSIKLTKFLVKVDNSTKRDPTGTSSEVQLVMEIRNSYGNYFEFTNTSRSLAASAACVAASIAEFFINSEKAFVLLHAGLKDAKKRNRQDLINRYTSELAQLVKSTSYALVIEKIKSDVNL